MTFVKGKEVAAACCFCCCRLRHHRHRRCRYRRCRCWRTLSLSSADEGMTQITSLALHRARQLTRVTLVSLAARYIITKPAPPGELIEIMASGAARITGNVCVNVTAVVIKMRTLQVQAQQAKKRRRRFHEKCVCLLRRFAAKRFDGKP